MKTLHSPLPLWLAIASFVFPLNAQSVSELELEKSSTLNVLESVTITPEMISGSGKLLVPTSGSQQFYRMKVRLLASPSISNPPPATTGIEEGGSVTFTVGSKGEGLTYQWYLGLSGDTSQPIQGAISQTYNTGALAADTSYWVKVTNLAGSINSETVAVTINRPPTIASQPASQTIIAGSTATLTVSATGPAPFTYQWYRGNLGATTAPVGTNSPTFTTPALTATTKYWVKTSNAFGEIQSSSVTVTVQANTAPTISDIAAQSINTGGNTSVIAFTIGDSQTAASSLTLSGSSSNTTLVPNANIVFGGSGASRTVTVTPASSQSGTATITVTVSDGSLTANDIFLLTVTVIIPPVITTQPASPTIVSGNTATLSMDASGSAPLMYQWYQGAVGTTTDPVGTNSTIFTTSILNSTTSYWVGVSNEAGTVNSTLATVTVIYPPAITTQPASTTINSGGTATFSVAASGTDPLTYQWYQGAAGTTTSPVGTDSASFTTATLSTTTTYWVQVSNAAGNTNSTLATVTVIIPPVITTQPASPTIISGNTATLSMVASSSVPLTYQWYQGVVGTTTDPVGTNSSTFTTSVLNSTTSYWVRVSNAAGTANSTLTTVAVVPVDMALIPAGSFTMGDSLDGGSNAPPVTVTVSALYMGKYEVTKALWDEVRIWGASNGYTDLAVGAGKATNHPVWAISWWDVLKWCNARSEKEGLTPIYTVSSAVMKTGTIAPEVNWSANGYRLPTEAEWEKAARGGLSGKRFPWGDTISHNEANYYASYNYLYDLSGAAENFNPTHATGWIPFTSPVGSFEKNGYGLHDMAGNVWEWCWDWYGASTYTNGATDPRGAASGSLRVSRGGGWDINAFGCRVAFRLSTNPSDSIYSVGLRVACRSAP